MEAGGLDYFGADEYERRVTAFFDAALAPGLR